MATTTRKTVSNVLVGILVLLALGMLAAMIWTANYGTEPVPGFHAARSTVVIVGVVLGVIAGLLWRAPDDDEVS